MAKNPKVLMKTSMGEITLELDEANAPISVENFLDYVLEGYFNGTIFHRVIPTMMIQGGALTASMERRTPSLRPASRPSWSGQDHPPRIERSRSPPEGLVLLRRGRST